MPLTCRREAVFPPAELKEAYQVILLLEGTLAFGSRDKGWFLKAPEVCCIRGVPDLSIRDRKRERLYHAVFLPSVVNTVYRDISRIPAAEPEDFFSQIEYAMFAPFFRDSAGISRYTGDPVTFGRLELLFSRLYTIIENPVDRFWPCRSRSYFLEILAILYGMSYDNGEPGPGEQEAGTLVDSVAAYLHTHYDEQISLEKLSAHFATNRTTLTTRFRSRFNDSVMSYLLTVRIRTACNLLRNTELSIAEIAERCGFGSTIRFWRAFKKKFDMTPGEYRSSIPSPYAS